MSVQRHTGKSAPEAFRGWLARRTNIRLIESTLCDEPSSGFSAWARTTTGVVVFLLVLQVVTGVLLAFYYVPSTESAHLTVSYIEKMASAGSWIRALHFYGSQWLTLALALHLAQMLFRRTYRRKSVGWLATLLLLALVSASGATGYSLPWDARAFYGTRVAESVARGLPLVGDVARSWLIGGETLSTLTLSRFYALHVLVLPLLIFGVVAARLFLFRESDSAKGLQQAGQENERATTEIFDKKAAEDEGAAPAHLRASWRLSQLARNSIVIALVFVALSVCASQWGAPLGPAAVQAAPGYLPRPGAQFLWLFQMLKYLPSPLASLAALLVPGLLLCALASLPFLPAAVDKNEIKRQRFDFGFVVLALGFLLIAGLTALAYLEDARNPQASAQLARQAQDEEASRRAPFAPRLSHANSQGSAGATNNAQTTADAASAPTPPAAYAANCAKCHGAHGEGKSIYPRLIGVSAQPRRTTSDLIAIMNNPRRYGLESRMPTFADKLSEEDKRAIAEWIASLK